MCSEQSGVQLEISKVLKKDPQFEILYSILLNDPRVKEEILKETRKYFELNSIENTTKFVRCP